MKKFWVNLLAVLLLAALAMNCAVAEPGEMVILDLDSDVDIQVESTDDMIILDDADMPLDIEELPTLGKDDIIALDDSLEDVEPDSVPASNAAVSNDGTEDFEIVKRILVTHKDPSEDDTVTLDEPIRNCAEIICTECAG